jgi:hypothetical protein
MKRAVVLFTAAMAGSLVMGGCGARLDARVPLAASGATQTVLVGRRVLLPEVQPEVFVSGDVASLTSLYRVVTLQQTPSRHGTVDPVTFSLENAVMWSGKVPIAPAIGIRDGRPELSDVERILRTYEANKVDLILQIDSPVMSNEALVPCKPGVLCLTSMLQVEQMKQFACTPVGALPSAPVISLDARVIRVQDARVVAVARGAIVAPLETRTLTFDEEGVPNGCRFRIFEKPHPRQDYRACCQGVLNAAKGKLQPEQACPDLAECRKMTASEAFHRIETLRASNPGVRACETPYSAAEVAADEKVPQTQGESIWILQQAVVHALLGGPRAPASVPPNVTGSASAVVRPPVAPPHAPAPPPAPAAPLVAAPPPPPPVAAPSPVTDLPQAAPAEDTKGGKGKKGGNNKKGGKAAKPAAPANPEVSPFGY